MSTAEINVEFSFSGIGALISSLLQDIKIKNVINICNILFIFLITGNGWYMDLFPKGMAYIHC